MADRFATSAVIGGTVTKEGFIALVDGAIDQGCGPDWGGSWGASEKDVEEARQHFLTAIFEGRAVGLMDDECSDGFAYVMTAARAANAAVRIKVEAKYEYDATIEMWRPGWRVPETVYSVSGEPALGLAELRKALEDEQTLADLILKIEKFDDEIEALAVEGHKVVRNGETYELVET